MVKKKASGKKPHVSIIIVTFNSNLKLLKECLNSIKKKTSYKNYNVVISDNGSTNGVIETVKKEYKWADLVENGKNIYWAGGNNSGIVHSLKKYNSDYYLLLNDDTKIIQKGWLSKLVKTAESDEKIGIVSSKIVYPDGRIQHLGGKMKGPLMAVETDTDKKIKEVDHVMGSVMMIKLDVVKKIGLVDEVFVPYLLDETDYCLRAKNAGFKVISDRRVKIIHHKGQTIDNLDNVLRRNFVRGKNDIIFSLANLKLHNALIRSFGYIPLAILLKKKDPKSPPSIKNFKIRENFFKNISVLFKVYRHIFTHLRMILKKRRDRKLNKKIWYRKYGKR